MNWLLAFVPVAIALEHWAPGQHLAIFAASGLGILPLAARMGRATEQLAERLGGLLNTTFGNAAELIIAGAALRQGLHDVCRSCWSSWCHSGWPSARYMRAQGLQDMSQLEQRQFLSAVDFELLRKPFLSFRSLRSSTRASGVTRSCFGQSKASFH